MAQAHKDILSDPKLHIADSISMLTDFQGRNLTDLVKTELRLNNGSQSDPIVLVDSMHLEFGLVLPRFPQQTDILAIAGCIKS